MNANAARRRARLVVIVAAVTVTLAVVAGCSTKTGLSLPSSPTTTAPTTSAATTAAPPDCGNPRQSFSPSSDGGDTVDAIRKRGKLRVAVSADTLLFGFKDPTDGQLKGFDIDVAKQISKEIFGDDRPLEYRVVSYGQRIPALQNDQVDLVADVMTINCARWAQINFSSEYYRAGQKVLVRKDSTAKGISDLDGQRVCAAKGSTNIEELKKYPKIDTVPVDDVSDCMVLFQQGKVDAVTADDTVLAGFVKQDPYAKVVGDQFTDEPYGLGIKKENVDFVRYVNNVLDDMRQDGRWKQFYDQDVRQANDTGPDPEPPQPLYGRAAP